MAHGVVLRLVGLVPRSSVSLASGVPFYASSLNWCITFCVVTKVGYKTTQQTYSLYTVYIILHSAVQ